MTAIQVWNQHEIALASAREADARARREQRQANSTRPRRPSQHHPDEWTERAACRNHENPAAFFPNRGDWRTEQTQAVLALCRSCQVRSECLEEAVRLADDHGIRGGLSGRERRQLREARP